MRELVGNCARFDFKNVADLLPRADLPALRPFLLNMLALNHRKVCEDAEGLSFKTPEEWIDAPVVRRNYEGLLFDRRHRSSDAVSRVLGVGHPAIDRPLLQATGWTKSAAPFPWKTCACRSPSFALPTGSPGQAGRCAQSWSVSRFSPNLRAQR